MKLLENHLKKVHKILSFFMLEGMIVIAGLNFGYSQQPVSSDAPLSKEDRLKEPAWILSDEICQLLNKSKEQIPSISDQDSLRAREAFKNGYELFKQYLKSKDIQLLLKSQPCFETALRIDCSDQAYQKAINGVYRLLEKHYRDQKNYEKAIILGERLSRLNEDNSKDYGVYSSLGNNYFRFNRFDYALINFIKAEELIENEIMFIRSSGDLSKIAKLNNQIFGIFILQNKIYNELYRPDEALKVVHKASQFVQNEKQKRTIENLIGYLNRWIFWKDKEALDIQIEINRLTGEKDYGQVQELYEKLLQKFTEFLDKRRVEVSVLYSSFEFQYLDQKPQSIERLLPYVVVPKDSVEHIENIQNLYNWFSSMCYIYGLEQLEKDRFASYCYFKQGFSVPSEFKENIALEILKLSVNNTSRSLNIGLDLWNNRANLSDTEKRWLCEYLIYANKRYGNPGAAHYFFEEYKKLLEGAKS